MELASVFVELCCIPKYATYYELMCAGPLQPIGLMDSQPPLRGFIHHLGGTRTSGAGGGLSGDTLSRTDLRKNSRSLVALQRFASVEKARSA